MTRGANVVDDAACASVRSASERDADGDADDDGDADGCATSLLAATASHSGSSAVRSVTEQHASCRHVHAQSLRPTSAVAPELDGDAVVVATPLAAAVDVVAFDDSRGGGVTVPAGGGDVTASDADGAGERDDSVTPRDDDAVAVAVAVAVATLAASVVAAAVGVLAAPPPLLPDTGDAATTEGEGEDDVAETLTSGEGSGDVAVAPLLLSLGASKPRTSSGATNPRTSASTPSSPLGSCTTALPTHNVVQLSASSTTTRMSIVGV
jgi:hypothetical protein